MTDDPTPRREFLKRAVRPGARGRGGFHMERAADQMRSSLKTDLRFSLEEASGAWGGRFNCGPAAMCAALNLTPDELHPFMGEFDEKGYTNPTLAFQTLDRLRATYRRVFRGDDPNALFPVLNLGLVRVQWGGPWTKPGVPMRVRYRKTHWVAARNRSTEVFDVNALCVGGWLPFTEWAGQLVPWLIQECEPKSDGTWWPTHAIELSS